jgi:hypothetical protein
MGIKLLNVNNTSLFIGRGEMSQEEIERELRMKQLANRDELEKVKARRLEREKEKEAREDETADMQRTKEAEQFKEWQQSEDQFHLEQAKLRSAIRIQVHTRKNYK